VNARTRATLLLATAALVIVALLALPGCTSTIEREGEVITTVCAVFCITHKREGKAKAEHAAETRQ
jgi:hypothetical protein